MSDGTQPVKEVHGKSITDAIASLERTITEQFQLLIRTFPHKVLSNPITRKDSFAGIDLSKVYDETDSIKTKQKVSADYIHDIMSKLVPHWFLFHVFGFVWACTENMVLPAQGPNGAIIRSCEAGPRFMCREYSVTSGTSLFKQTSTVKINNPK